jgi:2-polyprenyl-3-methyl-5-hydroxy-6-metoxy-1,4-benzoquinol methylase
MKCPLCVGVHLNVVAHENWSEPHHFQCLDCDLIFLDTKSRLAPDQEKIRYGLHQNSLQDSGYREFLMPIVRKLEEIFPEGERGSRSVLDFGCGPSSVLAALLHRRGFQVFVYDPYFAPHQEIFERQFDVIVSTEVFEHLYEPAFEIERLRSMLVPNGVLLVMTQLHQGPEKFSSWWYVKDPTHVVFYSEKTMGWIRNRWDFPHLLF